MDKQKLLPRHAVSIIACEEDSLPKTAMCSCGNFIEIYTADKTIRVQPPKSIDPQEKNPHAPWIEATTENVGSKNPIVSRIMLQGNQILQVACLQEEIKEAVKLILYNCKETLLICDRIAKKIQTEVDNIILKIEANGIPVNQHGRGLSSFPYVINLDSECGTFLINAKRAIKFICELVGLFIPLPGTDNNFKTLEPKLSKKLGKEAPLTAFVKSQVNYISRIIDLRNYQEHPGSKRTIIKNFCLTPEMQITVPQWYLIGEEMEPRSIKEEMIEIVNYLLEVAEIMLIHLVMTTVKKELPFLIEKIEETDINPDVPIKYRLTLNINGLSSAKNKIVGNDSCQK